MDGLESLFRSKNIRFYLLLCARDTVRRSARESRLSSQHATRLLKVWRVAGFVTRLSSLHGERYVYTEKGLELKRRLHRGGWYI
jgi:hypothetical protein